VSAEVPGIEVDVQQIIRELKRHAAGEKLESREDPVASGSDWGGVSFARRSMEGRAAGGGA
jgi:hypothetical protein